MIDFVQRRLEVGVLVDVDAENGAEVLGGEDLVPGVVGNDQGRPDVPAFMIIGHAAGDDHGFTGVLGSADKADIHTTKLASNAVRYDIYSLNRFRNWTVQKWVRVAKGAKPRFKVTVRWRADNCTVLRRDVKAIANVKTNTKVIRIRAPK